VASRWTSGEDARLRRDYRTGVPVAEIAARLGRSPDAVVARRALLAIPPRRVPHDWSPLEDRLVRAAADLPARVLAERMSRSVEQIRARRRRLGIGRAAARRYTGADDAVMRRAWQAGHPVDEIARRLGRSGDAVRLRLGALGLRRPPPRRRWTTHEDSVVRDGYSGGLTCACIADDLPGRTSGAVAARARKLGLVTYGRSWTAAEDERLRRLCLLRPLPEVARLLGRTPEAVHRRARRLGRKPGPAMDAPRSGARWAAQEDELLRLHAAVNPGVLASQLGRSDRAVVARMRQLGLREGSRRSPHHPAPASNGLTAGERRLLKRELARSGDLRLIELGRRFERSPASLRRLAGL
jgi:hypothetical protein